MFSSNAANKENTTMQNTFKWFTYLMGDITLFRTRQEFRDYRKKYTGTIHRDRDLKSISVIHTYNTINRVFTVTSAGAVLGKSLDEPLDMEQMKCDAWNQGELDRQASRPMTSFGDWRDKEGILIDAYYDGYNVHCDAPQNPCEAWIPDTEARVEMPVNNAPMRLSDTPLDMSDLIEDLTETYVMPVNPCKDEACTASHAGHQHEHVDYNHKDSPVHLDGWQGMKLLTHDGQTFLSGESMALFESLIACGWQFEDNYIAGNKIYVVLTRPLSELEEDLYTQHLQALNIQAQYS